MKRENAIACHRCRHTNPPEAMACELCDCPLLASGMTLTCATLPFEQKSPHSSDPIGGQNAGT